MYFNSYLFLNDCCETHPIGCLNFKADGGYIFKPEQFLCECRVMTPGFDEPFNNRKIYCKICIMNA